MYYCLNCKEEFENPKKEKITYEDYFGVSNEFTDNHTLNLELCPYCDSDEFEEMKKCDICGEYCRECDITDTECLIGGDIGDLCEDCARDCEAIIC